MYAAAFFQYGKQKHQPVEVHAVCRAAGLICIARRKQRLYLGKDRARALHHTGNACTGRVDRTAGQHDLGRIRNFTQPRIAHFKYADLVCGTETVFCGAQNAVIERTVAFKIQHAVHHVLQNLRSGDRAFLIDVADDKRGDIHGFCKLHHRHGAVFHLTDAAGRGGDVVIVHRLYRVNDQNIRFQILHALCNGVDIRFCKDEKIVTRYAEPLRAHFKLALAFLTGHIQDLRVRDIAAYLQQQRGFSDAGRAADQYERAANSAAAENAVHFRHAGGKTNFFLVVKLCNGLRDAPARSGDLYGGAFCCSTAGRCGGCFHDRVPRAARRAAAEPFSGFIAAFRAEKHTFGFHKTPFSVNWR